MAFCGNCGKEVQEGVKFCAACGQPVGAASGESTQNPQQPRQEQQQDIPPAAHAAPPQSGGTDAEENKLMAILAYILFFIPLLTGAHKTSPFVKYHTNQGTVLFIAAVVYAIAYGILSTILAFIPIIGWAIIALLGLASLVFFVLCIIGIINAINGKMKPLPVIGSMTIIK